MGRFANSWNLVKASAAVVRQDKELLVLPVLSFLASVVAVLMVVGVGFGTSILPNVTDAQGHTNPAVFVLTFLTYLLLAFVQVFFAAAVVAAARERMSGGNPTLSSALAAAGRRAGRLFVWALMVATVNILLQMLRERAGNAGRIVAALGGMAWNLATWFMVPVLLFEDAPVMASIGRSGSLFKKTWGETVIGDSGVGLVFLVVYIALALLGYVLVAPLVRAGHWIEALPLAVLVVAALVLVACIQSVLSSVYKAAVYQFATTGQTAGFTAEQLQGAFRAKA